MPAVDTSDVGLLALPRRAAVAERPVEGFAGDRTTYLLTPDGAAAANGVRERVADAVASLRDDGT
jgi:hypothetical protein